MYRIFRLTSLPVLHRLYSQVKKNFVYGLTEKEVADLREVWRVVEQAPLPVSKLFFKDLFKEKPEYQKKFKEFRGAPLLHNNDFIPHMRAVISSLNSIIRKLEDEKTVNSVMEYVATSHQSQGIYREEMIQMGKSVKVTLKELNKRKFNQDMEAAFDKFWAGFVEDYARRIEAIEKGSPKNPDKPPPKN